MIVLSALSSQYLQVPVTASLNGAPYNPTGDPVSFAFTTTGQPGPDDWHGGTWATTTSANGAYLAQILIGSASNGIPLGPGGYQVWVQITDNPEMPVTVVDTLRIV